MATATGNYVHDNSSLANFKNWAQAISNAFSTFGWTQTSDTGQVNWSTIASVPSSAYVYEIWKAADSQASTLPIYVKVEYGFSSTVVRIRMTPGTGSDGSGNITGGVSSAPWQLTSLETNNGATTYPCYFSGDAGAFRMYMWQTTSNNNGVLFGMSRSVDSSGNKTTDYFSAMLANASSVNAARFQTIISSSSLGPALSQTGAWPCGSANVTTGNTGSQTSSCALFPYPNKLGNPLLDFVGFYSGDVADGSTVTVSSEYGGTHTYIAASKGTITSAPVNSITGGIAIGMRYE